MRRFAAFVLLAAAASAQPSRGVNFYSLEKEPAIGKALADDYRRRTPSVDDPDLLAYVSALAARLNEFARSPFPLTIAISTSTSSDLDAVGLPGGARGHGDLRLARLCSR